VFKHKPRTTDIPDLKDFLIFLKKTNLELHDRYMAEIKKAFVADLLVFCCFLGAIATAVTALYTIYTSSYLSTDVIAELVIFLTLFVPIIVCSILGRKAHSQAIRIETEIEAEYHQSGFKEN
jgi:hypothetical protein